MIALPTKPGVLILLLALGACGYTPAQLGITGPSGAAAPPQAQGGNSDAQAVIPGVQTNGDANYATPSVRMP